MAAPTSLALAHVRMHAEASAGKLRAEKVLKAAGVDASCDELVAAITCRAPLTLNFHPDRLLSDQRTVGQALLEDGVYRGQFESGISNGGLTAFPGGDRDRWERRLFGGAYHDEGVTEADRPKYGGLNVMRFDNGACPRFGSCHIRLHAGVMTRATFSYGDSVLDPTDVGTVDALEPVLAGMLEETASIDHAFGLAMDVNQLTAILLDPASMDTKRTIPSRNSSLDDYIEAQIHGVLRLDSHVEAIAIDPSYEGSAVDKALESAAHRHGFLLERTSGTVLELAAVPPDVPGGDDLPLRRWRSFCAGGRALRLARRVASEFGDGSLIDPATIGRAAVSVVREPHIWEEWGSQLNAQTCLKDLWLITVAFGHAASG